MPIIPFFEIDPNGFLPTTPGETYTFDGTEFDRVGTADITDSDNILEDETETATGDITFSNGREFLGKSTEAEEGWQLQYTDPTTNELVQFQIVSLQIEDVVGSLDYYGMIVTGQLPPPGVEVTVLAFDGRPSTEDGFGVEYDDIVCFARGTRILTEQGEVAVEDLAAGDRVMTRDHGAQPIRWIGSRRVAAQGRFAPVVIDAGALGNSRELVVSPAHRMLIEDWRADAMFGTREVLASARHLTRMDGINRREGGEIEYFHILFDTHEIIYAEGAPSESFHLTATAADALTADVRNEILALFPELGETSPARPAVTDGELASLLA